MRMKGTFKWQDNSEWISLSVTVLTPTLKTEISENDLKSFTSQIATILKITVAKILILMEDTVLTILSLKLMTM